VSWRLDVPRLLAALSVAAERDVDGAHWRARCPSPDHDDSDPSWRIVDRQGERRHGSHKCWSCGFGGGPWELVAAVRGLELQEAGEWIRALGRGEARVDVEAPRVVVQLPGDRSSEYRLPAGVSVPSVDGSDWFPPALKYLRRRAVTDAQMAKWGIGFATIGEVAMRIVVPVRTRGRLVSHVARAFTSREPRYHVPRSGKRGARNGEALFGEPALREEPGVVIPCEGVFKHLRLELAGAPNPVAILGAQNLGPFKLAVLSAFPRILVAADPDAAGDSLFDAIRRGVGRASMVERLELELAPDDTTVPALREALRRAGVAI
jgi:DNA primase